MRASWACCKQALPQRCLENADCSWGCLGVIGHWSVCVPCWLPRLHLLVCLAGAAGNFLCPASVLSFNAFRTVMDIDTMGTFNVSRVLYEKFFRVRVPLAGPAFLPCPPRLIT